MAADGGGKASRFRWLYAARCAVAFVVTLIAVVVLGRAVVVMLRPEKLQLVVVRGIVSVDRITSMKPPPKKVTLRFTLTAYNPSGRVFLELSGVNIRLLDNNAPTPGAVNITVLIPLPDISVAQQTAQDSLVTVRLTPREDVQIRYVQELFDGLSITAAMEVDGLLSDRMKGITQTRNITYYCWPVTIAVGGSSSSSLSGNSGDTKCLDKSDAPAFQ